MVGNWFITNDDSLRKGEMGAITEDSILMYAKHGGANAHHYAHRLDAGKDPKQIDISVTLVNGSPVDLPAGVEYTRVTLKQYRAVFEKQPSRIRVNGTDRAATA